MSCPECFAGHVHAGQPRGRVATVYGADAYVSEPLAGTPARGVIVVMPEAFGWEFVNTRLIADRFADEGYRVYLPEFMNGGAAPVWMLDSLKGVLQGPALKKPWHLFWTMYGILPFLYRARFSQSHPSVRAFLAALRADPDTAGLPISAAGFAAHPSWVAVPQDISALRVPVSFALGALDHQVPLAKAREMERLFAGMADGERGKGEVRVYEGVGHGFAVRADNTFRDTEGQAREAERQCLEWMGRVFGGR